MSAWQRLAAWFGRGPAAASSRSTYAGAKVTQSTGAWTPIDSGPNEIINASAPMLTARVRQLVRDNPHFARAVNVLTDYTVGDGITYQPQVLLPDGSGLATRTNRSLEDAWNTWAEECDFAGTRHLYEIMRLLKRQDAELGEFLVVLRTVRDPAAFLPLRLQVLEADQLTGVGATPAKGNEVDAGIEYVPATGQVVAYHVATGTRYAKPVRIAAHQVLHGFEALRPGQRRGVTPFAPGVLLAHSLRDLVTTELDAARLAARIFSFVYSDSPLDLQDANQVEVAEAGDPAPRVEEMGVLIQQHLQNGEKIELVDPKRPGDAFGPFVKFHLQSLAITTSVPFPILTGNHEGLNYTVLRGIWNEAQHTFRVMQRRHVRQFCQPVHRQFLAYGAAAERFNFNGAKYFANPWKYRRAWWQPPGLAPIDPLKEGKAAADAIKNRLKSPQEIIRERGGDPEAVLDEFAAWQTMAEAKGITLQTAPTSTAVQSNPATLTGADQ